MDMPLAEVVHCLAVGFPEVKSYFLLPMCLSSKTVTVLGIT